METAPTYKTETTYHGTTTVSPIKWTTVLVNEAAVGFVAEQRGQIVDAGWHRAGSLKATPVNTVGLTVAEACELVAHANGVL